MQDARRLLYLATSLAVTAGGITLCYLLVHARPAEGKTMNAVLAESFASGWGRAGTLFIGLTLFAETALLFVAAQAGFIDGPRVMANMAHDSWLPHRFGQLSNRLSMQDGILLIATASAATLLYTRVTRARWSAGISVSCTTRPRTSSSGGSSSPGSTPWCCRSACSRGAHPQGGDAPPRDRLRPPASRSPSSFPAPLICLERRALGPARSSPRG